MAKVISFVRSIVSVLLVAVALACSLLLLLPLEAQASEAECELFPIKDNSALINHFNMQVNCVPTDPGYYFFDWGDGSSFDIELDANGDTVRENPHDYAYEVGALTVYTAGIDFDGIEGLDYTFRIHIDDRPKETYEISDVVVITTSLGTTWTWPVEINGEGEFIISVNNLDCNGFTDTYEGSFRTTVQGPITFDFANFVKSSFLNGKSDPNSGITIMKNGIVVLNKAISAPHCEAPKAVIDVQAKDEPYRFGETVTMTVISPPEASYIEFSPGNMIVSSYPENKCAQFNENPFDTRLLCEPGVHEFGVTFQPRWQSEVVRMYVVSVFEEYNDHQSYVDVELALDLTPICSLDAVQITPATYRLDYTWQSEGQTHSLHSGSADAYPNQTVLGGLVGSGSVTTTYLFKPGAIFTPTLRIVSEVNCETTIVMQEDLPDTTCTIDVREVEGEFNKREFKVTWAEAYSGNPTLVFGDNTNRSIGPHNEPLPVNGQSEWVVDHDYSWDTETGFAEYTAELVVPVGTSSVSCSEYVEILDPDFAPSVPPNPDPPKTYTFLPNVER